MLTAETASAESLSDRFRNVRVDDAVPDPRSAAGRHCRADDAGRQPDEVAPCPRHVVFRTFRARAESRKLHTLRRPVITIFSIPITTRPARCTRGRSADCCHGRRSPRCSTTAPTSIRQCSSCCRRAAGDDEVAQLTTLGLNHEQQHQELLLTDIKHVFSCNPLAARGTAITADADRRLGVARTRFSNGVKRHSAHRRNRRRLFFRQRNATPRRLVARASHR